MFFDSHIHLDFYRTQSGQDTFASFIAAAVAVGIDRFFVPGCRRQQWDELQAMMFSLPARAKIHVGVGQHPYFAPEVHDFTDFAESVVKSVKALRAVAIGECGLDKKRGGDMGHQVALFETHLKLAQELGLPCVVHCVGAQAELFRSVERVGLGPAGGVVHGFSGDLSFAQALIRRGFLLGVGPAVTRTSRQRHRDAVSKIPEDSYVLETDAPDQRVDVARTQGAPVDLIRVAEEVAMLRKQPLSLVSEHSTNNAYRLFGLKSN